MAPFIFRETNLHNYMDLTHFLSSKLKICAYWPESTRHTSAKLKICVYPP